MAVKYELALTVKDDEEVVVVLNAQFADVQRVIALVDAVRNAEVVKEV